MIGKKPRMRLIALLSALSLVISCKTKNNHISLPSVPQDVVKRMMNHPQIDKAWENVPEFTRDTLKVISDQSAEIETLKIDK